jgi:hypothetical protein
MAGVRGRSGGHNRKARAMRVVQGTFRADRDTGLAPEPPGGAPERPATLTGEAADEFDRMVIRLTVSGTISTVDDALLLQYALLFAETQAIARTQAETAGSIAILEENLAGLTGADLVACFQEITKLRQLEGRYISQIRQGRMGLRTFLIEFGMTPLSRNRVVKASPGARTMDPKKAKFLNALTKSPA